uniref:Uncharacterized protein n=1 Tax=Glossina brevipalpis TaxID=37001 RepID=A0A1A9WRF6_9MUSC
MFVTSNYRFTTTTTTTTTTRKIFKDITSGLVLNLQNFHILAVVGVGAIIKYRFAMMISLSEDLEDNLKLSPILEKSFESIIVILIFNNKPSKKHSAHITDARWKTRKPILMLMTTYQKIFPDISFFTMNDC